jgi:hypothetical protein
MSSSDWSALFEHEIHDTYSLRSTFEIEERASRGALYSHRVHRPTYTMYSYNYQQLQLIETFEGSKIVQYRLQMYV